MNVFQKIFTVVFLFGSFTNIFACPILDSKSKQVKHLGDPLFELLNTRPTCPTNVVEFRSLLQEEGAIFATTMVANRGFHNPSLGSFSFFEMVELSKPKTLSKPIKNEELFFGHFTAPSSETTLTLDQTPTGNSLMIELIAWDSETEMFNFYELIGTTLGPKWFYRGNSSNIWSDVKKLHLPRAKNEPIFGAELRCSGCHLGGGPILKEFSMPHDSWWFQERPLPFGPFKPDALVKKIMLSLRDPMDLANGVAHGIAKLNSGKAFKAKRNASPQIALRPLFCPEEIQLQASTTPLEGQEDYVSVPLGFFLDERLNAHAVTRAAKADYLSALNELRSRFPETDKIDADHAWNTPVKAVSDKVAIDELIDDKIDYEFVADVLAIDMTRPLLSQKRCALLTLLPEKWENWQKKFQENLKKSNLEQAQELLENFTDTTKTVAYHQNKAQNFIEKCQQRLQTKSGVFSLVSYLAQLRNEVRDSEISKNPRGQILEPGFRVIFPVFAIAPAAWSQTLSEDCYPR